MADFTETQVDWLQTAVGKRGDFAKAVMHEQEKSEKLGTLLGDIGELGNALVAAQDFSVEWTEKQRKHFWSQTKTETRTVKSMAWADGDRDSEIDTRGDLRQTYDIESGDGTRMQVDPEKARAVQKMHEKLVDIQTEMENAKDSEGNPLFTARDIERELWSPLIKANVIPSNAVADKYSQEAQVFNGAIEIYGEQLKQYTKTASKHDKLKRGLSIAKDTVALAGTAAAQAMAIAKLDGASMSQKDKNELTLLSDKDAGSLSPAEASRLDALNDQSKTAKELKQLQAYNTLAFGLANGAFDLADKSLDKPSEQRNWKIAEKAFEVVAKAAVASISADQAERAVSDAGTAKSANYKAATNSAKKLIGYSLSGSKVVFRFKDMLDADPGDRASIAKALVGSVADAVGNAFAAFDVPSGKDETGATVEGTGGQWAKVGAYISAGIVGAANTAQIAKLVKTAVDKDEEIDAVALVAAIGLNVVEGIMIGTFEPASKGVRQDVGDEVTSTSPTQETEKMRGLREARTSSDLDAMTKAMKGANGLFDAFPVSHVVDAEKMQAKMALVNAEQEEKVREAEFKDYEKRMKSDPGFKAALEADIAKETAERQKELMALIEDATPTPEDLADQEKAEKALAAMDKLIAEAEAVKTKWAVIDQLTSGGVGLLVKFLPGASLAGAIRQLAMDVAYLVKKSAELNLWMKNTALTYGNDSVYGPAITSRMASAGIQVSQKTLDTIFSLTGVVMESLRLADITGAATAGSIANTLARALSDYGYKMQKEAEISKGWGLYKHARLPENKGNRKMARKAMRWNSTLSKCVLAYGIVKDGDPIAKEVARNCGLTPEILQDDSEVCQKVVKYFMSVYSDDPVVLHRIPISKDWHPGTPDLSLNSWIRFKAAARTNALPRISSGAAKTPALDKNFAKLTALCNGGAGYSAKRDADFPQNDLAKRKTDAYGTFLEEILAAADGIVTAFDGYAPVNDAPSGEGETWTENASHEQMLAVAESLRAQAVLLRSEIKYDKAERQALIDADADDDSFEIEDLFAA